MDNDNQQIIDEICKYAEEQQIKTLLQEYLKRVVLAKPNDPIQFLIKSIEENPLNLNPNASEE